MPIEIGPNETYSANTEIALEVNSGLVNPVTLAGFAAFTSLDGESVFSISNRDYYNYCDNNDVCDCPDPS